MNSYEFGERPEKKFDGSFKKLYRPKKETLQLPWMGNFKYLGGVIYEDPSEASRLSMGEKIQIRRPLGEQGDELGRLASELIAQTEGPLAYAGDEGQQGWAEKNRIIEEEYSNLSAAAIEAMVEKGMLSQEYIQKRDMLVRAALGGETNHRGRRVAALQVAKLASRGFDPEFGRVLGKIVKGIKRNDGQKTDVSREQATALRVLCALESPDANVLLCQLLTAESLDPRIKKLVLARLSNRDFLGSRTRKYAREILHEKDSRSIRWEDFEPIVAVASIPSRVLREDAIKGVDRTFSVLSRQPGRLAEVRRLGERVPPEAILQVCELSERIGVPLERFSKVFAQIDSTRVREELTFLLTNLLSEDTGGKFWGLGKSSRSDLLLRPLMMASIDKKDIPVLLSALRKGLFIMNSTSNEGDDYIMTMQRVILSNEEDSGRVKGSISRAFDRLKKQEAMGTISIDSIARDLMAAQVYKPIARINDALRHEMAEVFGKMFPGGKVRPERLDELMEVWDDVDPLFLYASKLDVKQGRKTLDLIGEMIVNLDPPQMERWKAWRYNISNEVVSGQIGFLPEQVRQAYARDRVLEMSQVMMGVDLAARPGQIRHLVFHAVLGHLDDPEVEQKWASRELRDLFQLNESDGSYEQRALKKIAELDRRASLLQRVVVMLGDRNVANRAGDTLEKWWRTEDEKRSRLHRAGIFNIGTYEEAQDEIAKIRRLDLTLDEEKIITQLAKEGALDEHQKLLARIDKRRSAIEEPAIGDLSRFAELMETIRRSLGLDWQKKVEAYRKINLIASCSPKVLDVKLQTFLDRNNLGIDASAIDISKKGTELSQMLSKLMGSTNFADICRDIGVTDTSSLKELYAALDHLKNTVNMIKLTTLSPEAIAFDRLTVVGGNPDATPSLAATLESCRKYFEGTIIEAEIDGVKDLIGGTSEVARERNLLFIFTDNPLVGLTIGRYPIGAQSCQKYWNGSDTLAAYPADAMTKICILVDKSKLPDEILSEFDSAGSEDERLRIFNRSTDRFLEAIVARRVTKVVRKILPKREPALFLEPIYTPYDRRQMTKYMNMGAVSGLLKELGLPLVCGGSSFKVKVAGSRNTEQYEDGEFGGPDNGGMGTKTGEYTMAARDLREDDYK